MTPSVNDLWKLLVQSRLLTHEQCQHLSGGFAAVPGAADTAGRALAEWLVRQNVLSKYQARILLAGRAGPFFYGEYKIYDRIEVGRLSGSFRAVHVASKHPVVLRFLAGPVTQSPQAWAEIQMWVALTGHPHVVRCHEAVDLGAYKFLVLENLRGQSIAELLERLKRLPADEASRLARMAALGLSWLHDHGRVHGDVRPANLWLDANGNLKLLLEPEMGPRCFDMQVAVHKPDGLTRADYAAPELLQAGRPPDPLVDVYSLGCTLYEMIAGQPPFSGGDVQSKMKRHSAGAIPSLESFGCPLQLGKLIAYAMAKNPAVRIQQAARLAEQLQPFLGATQQNLKTALPPATQAVYELWLKHQHPVAVTARPLVQAPLPTTTPAQLAAMEVAIPAVAPHPSQSGAASSPLSMPIAEASTANLVAAKIRQRAKAKQRNNLIFLSLSILAVVGALSAVLYVMSSQNAEDFGGVKANDREAHEARHGESSYSPPSAGPPKPSLAPRSDANNGTLASAPQNSAEPRDSGNGHGTDLIAQDDGTSLWSSPTAGQAIRFQYVPPGAQLFLVARPSALLASAEGQRFVKALGPRFETTRQAWEAAAGVRLDQVDQLIVALYGNEGHTPKATFVVRLKGNVALEEIRARWGTLVPADGLPNVSQHGAWAYYAPPEDRHLFVMGPLDPEIKEAAAAGWKAPLLRRELGQLLRVSDEQRHLTILFAPNFLYGDGQELFAGSLSPAKKPLEWFLGDGLKAGLISLHLANEFYFEMRMESDIHTDRYQLASHFRERIAEIPGKIETYIADLNPHPYWRLVAFRYPAMIRFLHDYTRVGVEGSHAVLNSVLPGQAAHNLVFGGEMILASMPDLVAAPTVTTKPIPPQNMEEVLQAKISIEFAQDSLEFSMQNVVAEVKAVFPELPIDFQIKIVGADLEKDGITRNQQLRDFNQTNKSVAEVLTALVRKANPVTTVKAPSEPDQKLLWVVDKDPEHPAQQIILITTRAAAAQKKYTLPAVFRPE